MHCGACGHPDTRDIVQNEHRQRGAKNHRYGAVKDLLKELQKRKDPT
jgi:hypothetical protein